MISNVKSNNIDEVLTAELASSRLRAGICINSYFKNDYLVSPLNLSDGFIPDLVFMGKYVPDSGTGKYIHDGGVRYKIWKDLIKKVKDQGSKFIVDYTDNHLSQSTVVGDFYKDIVSYADGFVVPSVKMNQNLLQYVKKPTWIIPEPFEVVINQPKTKLVAKDELQILWFGHNSNLQYLYNFIEKKLVLAPKYHLVVLSDLIDENSFKSAIAKGRSDCRYSYAKWSLELMQKVSLGMDLCVIPGDANDPKKNGVSSGRLISAIAMGLPTIAEPLPSYLPYADFFLRADDFDQLKMVLNNPLILSDKTIMGQQQVLPSYSMEYVGQLWLRLFSELN